METHSDGAPIFVVTEGKDPTQAAYEWIRKWVMRPGARQAMDSDRGQCMYLVRPEGTTRIREDDYHGEMEYHSEGIPACDAGYMQRCAVGCLLDPEALYEYAESTDGATVVIAAIPWAINESFLVAAQNCHDAARNWQYGRFLVSALDEVAEEHGLDVVQ